MRMKVNQSLSLSHLSWKIGNVGHQKYLSLSEPDWDLTLYIPALYYVNDPGVEVAARESLNTRK